jgi:hypothetical protein
LPIGPYYSIERVRTYFWDFFGPRAEHTAAHFAKHLAEFLQKHACTGAKTRLISLTEQHHAVACETPSEWQDTIERALRPRRSEG